MHHPYRRAKHFKLSDDLEVDDRFSQGKKTVKKDWDYYDYHSPYNKFGTQVYRYLESCIGKPFHTSYSKFLEKCPEKHKYWLRERFLDSINQKVIVHANGDIENLEYKYRWYNKAQMLGYGDYYVHPKSNKILKVLTNRYVRKPYKGPLRVEIDADNYFEIHSIKYNRRIGCGVIEEVVDKVWVKRTRVIQEDKRYVYVWDKEAQTHVAKMEPHFYEVWQKHTASKQEIKQYKLKEKENDN